jgi:hypothetical protein
MIRDGDGVSALALSPRPSFVLRLWFDMSHAYRTFERYAACMQSLFIDVGGSDHAPH